MSNKLSVTSVHMRVAFFGLMILAFVSAGCAAPSGGGEAIQGSQAPAATSAPMATTVPAPTAVPATAVPATAVPAPTKAVTTTGASAATAQIPVKPATVMVSKNDKLGQILTDNNGKTLYLFTKDTKDTSNCYDNCATAWPPLLTTGAPVVGDGANGFAVGNDDAQGGYNAGNVQRLAPILLCQDQKAGDTTGRMSVRCGTSFRQAARRSTPRRQQPARPQRRLLSRARRHRALW